LQLNTTISDYKANRDFRLTGVFGKVVEGMLV